MDDKSGTPEDDKSGTAEDNKSGTAEDNKSGTPEDDKSGTAEDNKSGSTEDNQSGSTEDNQSGTPEDNKSGTPEDDKSGTPEDDKSGAPEDNKSGTPEDDKSGSPEDKSDSKEKRVFEIPTELKESKKLDSHDDEDNKDENLFVGTLKRSEDRFVVDRRVSFAEDSEENKKISGTTDNKQEHEYSKDANEKPDEEKKKQKDDDKEKPVSILKTSDSKFDTKEERFEVPDETSEDSDEPQTSSNRRLSFTDRLRKKSVSIIDYFSGKSSDEEEEEENESTKARETSSWMGRKLVALEQQLAADKIEKRMKNIFAPEPPEREGKDGDKENNRPMRVHLSSSMACMFIIAATTGGALPSLPYNLKQSGWFGVFLNLLIGLNALYAGLCTGWCWDLMEEKWPEYLEYSRIPYQDIGYRAVGMWMKYFVGFCVDVACLGSAAVYILLIGDTLEKLAFPLNFCFILVVVSFLMMPIMMFSSYRNFQFIGKLDVLASIMFVVLLVISFFLDRLDNKTEEYTDPSFKSVAMAFAGFSFAYGSGAILPSIMADMEDRSLFPHSCATAYLICIILYILLPLMGYAAYGDDTPENILKELTYNEDDYVLRVFINATHIVQLLTSYVIALIPSLHAFEERTYCPDDFGFRRFLVRVSIMFIILLVILGLPMLDKFIVFVGASIVNLCTFIFPPIFYVCLTYKTKRGKKRNLSKKELLCLGEIIILGISVGVVAVVVSISKLQNENTNDRVSCYVNASWVPEST